METTLEREGWMTVTQDKRFECIKRDHIDKCYLSLIAYLSKILFHMEYIY